MQAAEVRIVASGLLHELELAPDARVDAQEMDAARASVIPDLTQRVAIVTRIRLPVNSFASYGTLDALMTGNLVCCLISEFVTGSVAAPGGWSRRRLKREIVVRTQCRRSPHRWRCFRADPVLEE